MVARKNPTVDAALTFEEKHEAKIQVRADDARKMAEAKCMVTSTELIGG